MEARPINPASIMTKSTRSKKLRHPAGGPPPAPEVEVQLEFTRPGAASVSVAGTFNNWRPGATPMIPVGEGRWIKQLRLAPGRYEYCLVVDAAWMPDPLAKESVANPYGGLNSVLHVTAHH